MPIRFKSAVPQFRVPDVVATAEYYERVLGFEIAGYWNGERVHHDPTAPAVFGIVRRDQVAIHFHRADESQIARGGEGYDVYLHVNGVDDLAADLRERGAEILEGPEDRVYGQREVIVKDCNGLVLAFGEAIGEAIG